MLLLRLLSSNIIPLQYVIQVSFHAGDSLRQEVPPPCCHDRQWGWASLWCGSIWANRPSTIGIVGADGNHIVSIATKLWADGAGANVLTRDVEELVSQVGWAAYPAYRWSLGRGGAARLWLPYDASKVAYWDAQLPQLRQWTGVATYLAVAVELRRVRTAESIPLFRCQFTAAAGAPQDEFSAIGTSILVGASTCQPLSAGGSRSARRGKFPQSGT